MISDKLRPHHLERKALLYARQSSAHQVLEPGTGAFGFACFESDPRKARQ
jgi:hypothetical protein